MRISIREKDLVTLGFLCGIAFAAAAPLVFSLRPLPKESAVFPGYAVVPTRAERAEFERARADRSFRVPLRFKTDYEYLVDLNRAGKDELVLLPEIGPALADRILEYRAAAGGFRSKDELLKVKGIGEKKYAKIEPFLLEF
ncbi:MAG: helix-hairpin-helix domain-containing protein [Thermoguttaceae bacterium]|nr:helix-hairpin-helix domain-containing protein [Thermoguttaceae bacterium]